MTLSPYCILPHKLCIPVSITSGTNACDAAIKVDKASISMRSERWLGDAKGFTLPRRKAGATRSHQHRNPVTEAGRHTAREAAANLSAADAGVRLVKDRPCGEKRLGSFEGVLNPSKLQYLSTTCRAAMPVFVRSTTRPS